MSNLWWESSGSSCSAITGLHGHTIRIQFRDKSLWSGLHILTLSSHCFPFPTLHPIRSAVRGSGVRAQSRAQIGSIISGMSRNSSELSNGFWKNELQFQISTIASKQLNSDFFLSNVNPIVIYKIQWYLILIVHSFMLTSI